MIESLDESIRQLLIQKTPLNQAEVDISFDVPNREWSGTISKPTINIYLHDIRENLDLRETQWTTEHNADGTVTRIKLGGRYDLSYLITAWTKNVEDEHRLLWYVLATMVRYPYLPDDVLEQPLSNQPYPLYTKVAQPDGVLRNAADVWTALDNQLKPVLTYVVTVSLTPHVYQTTKQVRSKFLRFLPPEGDGAGQLARGKYQSTGAIPPPGVTQYLQIGGHVRDATQPDRPVQAEVILLEQGLNVRTDAEGRYTFGNLIERSQYTLLAVASGYTTTRQVITVPATSYDLSLQPEPVAAVN